jgi:hypothetical protein
MVRRVGGRVWSCAVLVIVIGYCLSVLCRPSLLWLRSRISFIISSRRSKFGTTTNLPRFRNPLFNILKKLLRLLQSLYTALVLSPPQEDRKLYRTYRKVTTPVMALVVDQVRQSSRPATRNREQLFREERVSERLVEEGCGRSGRCPLWLMNVSAYVNVGGRVRLTAEMLARRGRSSGEDPCY